MSRRYLALALVAALVALAVAGCVHAPPAFPPPAGPPGPENGTDWPVVGNGPSEDATAAYLANPNKAVDIDLNKLPGVSGEEGAEGTEGSGEATSK